MVGRAFTAEMGVRMIDGKVYELTSGCRFRKLYSQLITVETSISSIW